MLRRGFLGLGSGALVAACARAPASRAPQKAPRIRAVAFDLFTLFDPRSVDAVAETVVPGRGGELCEAWRVRQFEYTWIRIAADRYRDFRAVTEDALVHAAASRKIRLSADARATLLEAYERLDLWPDSVASLARLKGEGLKLAPLANFTPQMIENLLRNGRVRSYFDEILATDRVRSYKPDPKAYALGPRVLGLAREEIAFAAFGGWDAAGARWYGYPTFWVNRLDRAPEELAPGAHATGATLTELVSWVLS